MDLKEIYSLRKDFTIIGITGRTGSGCTKLAELLGGNVSNLLDKVRNPNEIPDSIFKRKYEACYKYIEYEDNWQPYTIIKYKDVLLFYILSIYGGDQPKTEELLNSYYRDWLAEPKLNVGDVIDEIKRISFEQSEFILKIKKYNGDFEDLKERSELEKLCSLFFSEDFEVLSKKVFTSLENHGYFARTKFLHWLSCNIRQTGDPMDDVNTDISKIFTIAKLINKLIKAKRTCNGLVPTKIVIDSLRNSLEVMFFKERYSAFYMIATKDYDQKALERIQQRLTGKPNCDVKQVAKAILKLDETEYKCSDFRGGNFSSPDVENCIQKSDIHIVNQKREDLNKLLLNEAGIEDIAKSPQDFFLFEEQVMKLAALIGQPGIVTPSADERCMQIAYTAKYNSGCISRQVGAVITDVGHSIKSVGWNDVPKGTTSCKYRTVTDLFENGTPSNLHYSEFERADGDFESETSYKYKGKEPGDFRHAAEAYYKTSLDSNGGDLNGKNCSFCFKSIHNYYEGESNQVHTKSLHAEENAMMQISKHGGQPLENGILYTTASPCELCAKKSFQLGIIEIVYIDPYPGISSSQILKNGLNPPIMKPFNGVIGRAYHSLYESFMSYKDELQLMLELKPLPRKGILKENILKSILGNDSLKNAINESKIDPDQLEIELLKIFKANQ